MQDDDDNDPMSEAFSLIDGEESEEDDSDDDDEIIDFHDLDVEDLMQLYDQTSDIVRLEEIFEEIQSRLLTQNRLEEHFEWALKTAEKGGVNAQGIVAESYEMGRGVEKNLEKSIFWLRKAAEGGCPHSQVSLGWAYQEGDGVEKNCEMALYWYEKSAGQGHLDAFSRCGHILVESGDYKGAMSWLTKGVGLGDAESMVEIGEMYRFGHGVKRDPRIAFEWYQNSVCVNADCASGYLNLGLCYHLGNGVPVDLKKAKTYYELSAKLECPVAMNNLADMYWKGHGVERNFKTATKWVKKAIDAGSFDGVATYGEMILDEEKDYVKAFELFKKSSDSGECTFSHFLLGKMYENGWGCEKDISKAYFLYLKGAKEKDEPAIERLESPFKNELFKSNQLYDLVIFTKDPSN